MGKRSFSIGAICDTGNVKKVNQDSILVKIGEEQNGEFGIFVVADGLGGLAAGEIASDMATAGLKDWWDNRAEYVISAGEEKIIAVAEQELDSIFTEINIKIMGYGKSIGERVGTTTSLLFIYKDKYIVKHIGDSRVYIINSSVRQITMDHSWVAQQVRDGNFTPEEAGNHPKKNILTQCIGVTERIDIFSTEGEVREGDAFLLCSDGFHNLVSDEELLYAVKQYRQLLVRGGDSQGSVQGIVERLLDSVKQRGANDNVSAVLVYVNESGKDKGIVSRLKGFIKKQQ